MSDRRTAIERAAQQLWRPIPAPRRAQPKPAGSWRLLKANQWLTSTKVMNLAGVNVPPGTLWKVAGVDDQGAYLHGPGHMRWTNPEWKGWFERARKPKGVK